MFARRVHRTVFLRKATLTLCFLALMQACTPPVSPPPPVTEEIPEGIFIKGSLLDPTASLSRASTSSLDITSAVLFYGSSMKQVSVVDHSFNIKVDTLKPAGIIFVGLDNSFKGYVDVGSNMSSLPLQAVDVSSVSIDLGLLTINEKRAAPANDPFQHLGGLTLATKQSLAHAGKLFSSVIQNPDFDNNGILDILENKSLSGTIIYYLSNPTTFGTSLTPSVAPNSLSIGSNKILVGLKYPELPTSATITRPGGTTTGHSSIRSSGTSSISIFFPSATGIPVAGGYRFQAGALDYTFTISDQSAAEDSIVTLIPTVELNSDGTIHSIAWKSYHRDMTPLENINLLFSTLEVQIDVVDDKTGSYVILDGSSNRVYNSGNVPASDMINTPANQGIFWTDVKTLYLAYNDLYGNHYVLGYNK